MRPETSAWTGEHRLEGGPLLHGHVEDLGKGSYSTTYVITYHSLGIRWHAIT